MPTTGRSNSTAPIMGQLTHDLDEYAYFVFALRSGRGGNMSFFLEGCKVLALRTWLGARINTAKFQEVFIFDGVFMC